MKKLISFILLCFVFIASWAQNPFTIDNASGSVVLEKQPGVDFAIIINEITSSTELNYVLPHTTINWYKFTNPTFSINNTPTLSPDGDTGYIMEVDGERKTLWVFDYKDYKLDANKNVLSIIPDTDEDGNEILPCEEMIFEISNSDNLFMKYKDLAGTPRRLSRKFTISYNSLTWSSDVWASAAQQQEVELQGDKFMIPTPLEQTVFTFQGDEYAEQMGLNPIPVIEYDGEHPIGLQIHTTTTTVTRDALNEINRPKDTNQLEGSAPLEIEFKSNPSESRLEITYPHWAIYRNNALVITRATHDHRYTFTEPGSYKVRLQMDNAAGCTVVDSVLVEVSESDLRVPNAFSPNGDGINDEFRVVYRSLKNFHCWVYNNWGKLVYEWTDPAKGWDGKINGRDAAPSAYFYIIRAEGTEGKIYKLKGDINLFR